MIARALTAAAGAGDAVELLERAVGARAGERDGRGLPREIGAGHRVALFERERVTRAARLRKAPRDAGVARAHDEQQRGARAFLVGGASESTGELDQRPGIGTNRGARFRRLHEQRDGLGGADRSGALDTADALVRVGGAEQPRGVVGPDVRAHVHGDCARGSRRRGSGPAPFGAAGPTRALRTRSLPRARTPRPRAASWGLGRRSGRSGRGRRRSGDGRGCARR